MIIDCISDLHGFYPKLEGGDLLIVAGDLTARDDDEGYTEFSKWFNAQKYKKKVFIAGNHDNQIQNGSFPLYIDGYSEYLCDSGIEFEGLKVWGSPWTRRFEGMNPHCMAFTVDTEEEFAKKWALIPDDVNILVTHSPSYGILDQKGCGCIPFNEREKELDAPNHLGAKSLRDKIRRIQPKLHVFGHIHECGGKMVCRIPGIKSTFVNASHVNERYEPVNKPIRIEL